MTRELIKIFEGFPSIFDSNLSKRLYDDSGSWESFFTKEGGFPYDVVVYADQDGDAYKTEVVYAVAGVSREHIKVKVEGNYLEVTIDNNTNAIQDYVCDDGTMVVYAHKGISHRKMVKKFTLGEGIAKDEIESKLENGLLTITLPTDKKSNPNPVNIRIM